MAIKRRTKKQVASDKAALKRLQKSKLYKGKIDLRRAPSRYQVAKLKIVAAVRKLAAKARAKLRLKAAKPAPQRTRKTASKTKTKPSAKSKRQPLPKGQPAGGRIRRTRIAPKRLEKMRRPKNPLVTYVLPFNRRGGIVEWRRFTYDQLQTFLKEYVTGDDASRKRAAWREYAVREVWSFETKDEREAAREVLEEQIFGQHDHETTRATAKRKRARNRQSKHSRVRGK